MKNWKQFLKSTAKLDAAQQLVIYKEINKAFRCLINSKPTEEVFTEYTKGVLLTPEMLFYLVKNSRKLK